MPCVASLFSESKMAPEDGCTVATATITDEHDEITGTGFFSLG